MDKREFIEGVDMYAEPYKYWIAENEPEEYAKANAFKGEAEAMEELTEVYEFFELKEGVRANGFATRVKEALAGVKYDAVYFDEDVIDTAQSGGMAEAQRRFTGRGVLNRRRRSPYFKPDFSPDTLRSFYYPGALTLVSRDLAERVAAKKGLSGDGEDGFELGLGEGSDLDASEKQRTAGFLRDCLLEAREVLHIPQVLYHTYEDGDIEYGGGDGTSLGVGDTSITCVILSKDNPEQLKTCVGGLRACEERENVKVNIVVVDNGSSEENRREATDLAEKQNFKYIYEKSDFVYSRLNNLGAKAAKEDFPDDKYLLFLNDDVEIPGDTSFLKKMAIQAGLKHTGAVGVKLLYPDGETIQHIGISLLRSGPSHKLNGYSDGEEYYHGVNVRDINVLAVTGACLMVRREVFEEVGGFDEALAVGYTDTELCVKLLTHGYYNVCLNSVSLIHHEGLSRGRDLASRRSMERLLRERDWFYKHFGDFLRDGDPFYSPNLTDTDLDYSVRLELPGRGVPLSVLEEYGGEFVLKLSGSKDDGTGGADADNNEAGRISGGRVCKADKLKYSVDYCGFELNDEYGNTNFYDIKGWAYIEGDKGYGYEKWLLLRGVDGKTYRVRAADTYREDVAEVFGRDGLNFAGFEAKIISDELKGGVYAVALALIKNRTNKGYCREDVCRIETV